MKTMIAIDPGHAGRGNAVAQFEGERLVHTWFERTVTQSMKSVGYKHGAVGRKVWEGNRGGLDLVLVERPEYQGQRSQAARPTDLMNLAWSGALLAGQFSGRDGCPIIELPPSVWKGSESKPVNHKRLWAVLDAAEREVLGGLVTEKAIRAACVKGALARWGISGAACYPKSFDTHNLLDAAAIGCYFLGRLKKVG
jgi:hypothetical protein